MLSGKQLRKVAIVGYNRIPFARQNTTYANAGNKDMMTAALGGLIDKYNLAGKQLGEVAGGAVIKHSWEINLMRECVLASSLDPKTPACDIEQACNTGIESAVYIANKIALGQLDCGIAGGVDSTSNVPLVLNEHIRSILLSVRRSKSTMDKIKKLLQINLKDFTPIAPMNIEPGTGLSMGGHTEYTAKYYKISREDQDRFSLESHQKMASALDRGFFDDMITPYKGLLFDNNMRRDSSIEKLAKLKPAFDKENGSLTAGNSSPLTDGASCILLASEEWAQQNNLPILAYITHAEIAAIEYIQNKHNLLLSAIYAAPKMLKKAGMKLQDFDFYEIHEAFAAQVLATLKIWESPELTKEFGLEENLGAIDRSKLNVNGSSLAAGHPFAATGGRILATMAKLLNEKGSGKGFISVCAAGGQGITVILEK
ncbi:acetyl-CoA C-acetyltransferase [Flavobacterium alkalisoli]|uniref:Acetyl-CoA C-acetyltransferase n=1 Tax=Flavobacterium alkalisoli TaxID=2602769 RepID=A0A5B9FW27_9FLAO|nr:acetyl-CoA C-acetyltransferase [Flavobacterium alkalisoli]QEE50469.1 acetyl-CoA C-acetyltransferase [Flavobacterium alkalisoli]